MYKKILNAKAYLNIYSNFNTNKETKHFRTSNLTLFKEVSIAKFNTIIHV